MNELLHRSSALLAPVWTRLLEVIRSREVVLADETRLRILRDADGKPKTGFVWTFGATDRRGELDVAYIFADNRSGATPKALLEGTKGVLLVDGYSGYNDVEKVSSRRRAACFAHVRRYFFESLKTAPVAQEALDLIADLYCVEHDAKEKRLSQNAHLDFSQTAARDRCASDSSSGSTPSKRGTRRRAHSAPPSATRSVSGTSSASFSTTRACLSTTTHRSARCDGSHSIGRTTCSWGDVAAGKSFAGLYSLVATCESRSINPFDYLRDVLARVQDHPAKAIDDLLPGNWAARD